MGSQMQIVTVGGERCFKADGELVSAYPRPLVEPGTKVELVTAEAYVTESGTIKFQLTAKLIAPANMVEVVASVGAAPAVDSGANVTVPTDTGTEEGDGKKIPDGGEGAGVAPDEAQPS